MPTTSLSDRPGVGFTHLLFVLLLTSILLPSVWAQCNKTLTAGWNEPLVPWNQGTPVQPSGFTLEILEAVIAETDCELKHSPAVIPWARQLLMIEQGSLDIAIDATQTPERDSYAYFTDPYRSDYVGLLVKTSNIKNFEITSIEDLEHTNIILGAYVGWSYGERADKVLKRMGSKVRRIPEKEYRLPRILALERLDSYMAYLPGDIFQLKQEGLEHVISLHPMPLVKTGDLRFMLSKQANSIEILHSLNHGLATIKKNGIYDRIIKKYTDKYGIDRW